MAKLRIVDGPLAGTEFALRNRQVMVAGRYADCAIPVPDPRVSRNHAEFVSDQEGRFSVLDLGSANGTLVNGVRIEPNVPRPIHAGDEIRMGQSTFRFFAGDARLPDVEISGYTLTDLLADGGMGTICRAVRDATGTPAAVKILHADHGMDEEAVERFIQEARAASRLSHPNIVKVYNVGKTWNGRYYFTMELVKGATLAQRMAGLGRGEALRMFMAVADALEYAHARGIVHRDVKPDNILVTAEGEPKLTDLGIALLDQRSDGTGGQVLGTPHYMSPEQALGRPVDRRTDIYSLGATFYHVFAERPVFDGREAAEIMARHVREPHRPLLEAAPDIPADAAAIVDRCLRKNPDDRFAAAGELRDALAASMRKHYPGLLPEAERADSPGAGGGKPRLAAAGIALAAGLLAAALLLLFWK